MNWNRRDFLRAGLTATALLALPGWARAALPSRRDVKTLSFHHLHTGESLREIPFWERGALLPDALAEINHLLRDFRTGDVAEMDAGLLHILAELQEQAGSRRPFHIISAYRSPKTNAMLHAKSSGVAKGSLHTRAMALDIRLPGTPLATLREIALSLQTGGVGYYPKSDFVHVDTGRVRWW
jgi:uncharacterized protein YcbK (DUF882 family)